MQVRAALEPRCHFLQMRCRSHEQSESGALLRRLLAQLCGCDVLPTLQHLLPVLSQNDPPPTELDPAEHLRRSELDRTREKNLLEAELQTLAKLVSAARHRGQVQRAFASCDCDRWNHVTSAHSSYDDLIYVLY